MSCKVVTQDNKVAHWNAIQSCLECGITLVDSYNKMQSAESDKSVHSALVCKWHKEFSGTSEQDMQNVQVGECEISIQKL